MVSEKKEYICDICGKELTTLPGLNGHRQFAHGQAKHMLADTPEAAIVELLSELTGAFSRIEAGAEAQAERVKHLEAVLAEVDKRLDGFKSDLLERLEAEQAGHEQAEKRASRAEELAGSHPAPDDKLLEAWENCANCRPKLRDFYDQLTNELPRLTCPRPGLFVCPEFKQEQEAERLEQEAKRQAEAATEAGAERSEQLKEARTQRFLVVCGGYRGGFKWSDRLSSMPSVPDGIEGEDCGYYKVVEDASEADKYQGKGSFRVIELESVEEIVSGPEVEA